MSDEIRDKDKGKFEFPMMPIYGVDLGRELGDMSARLKQLETGQTEIKSELKTLDAKTDKMAYALNRLDERTQHQGRAIWGFGIAILAAVVAGFILQYFGK